MSYWPQYERRPRIQAKDGIKSRTTKFASEWWAKQWLSALDAFGWSNRLARGRSYARSGQVLDYSVTSGKVTAGVQGSRRKPYQVTLRLKALSEKTWEQVLDVLADRAEFAARLLAGDMPEDIGEAFARAGASLLPQASSDRIAQTWKKSIVSTFSRLSDFSMDARTWPPSSAPHLVET